MKIICTNLSLLLHRASPLFHFSDGPYSLCKSAVWVVQLGNLLTLSHNPVSTAAVPSVTQQSTEEVSTPLYVSGGLPPIPAKLAKHIQDGHFIEMVKLLPESLRGFNSYDEDQLKSSKPKHQEISNIINWIQCFSLYTAIICHSQPQQIIDLLGYQKLIITSHMWFPDFNWATYDREFCQQSATKAKPEWSVLDNTLRNFAGQ